MTTNEPEVIDMDDPSLNRSLDDGAFATGSGAMSARNAGWYEQFLPQQRYQAYLLAHLALMDYVKEGTIETMPDEIIAILAWAVVDDEAYDAGKQLLAEDEYKDLEFFHDMAYGEGTTVQAGYTNLDIPRFDMDDVEGYNHDIIMIMTDGTAPIDLDTAAWKHYDSGSNSGFVRGMTGFIETGVDIVEEVGRGVQRTVGAEPTFEIDRFSEEPTADVLFHAVSQEAAAPGEKDGALQVMANMYDKARPISLDLAGVVLTGAVAGPIAGGWLSFIGRGIGAGLTKVAPPVGKAAVTAIVKTLAGTKTALSAGWQMRRPIGAVQLTAATTALAHDVNRIRSMKVEDLTAQELNVWMKNLIGEKPEDMTSEETRSWQEYAGQQRSMWRRAVNRPYIQAPYKDLQITDLVDPVTGRSTVGAMDRMVDKRNRQGASPTAYEWRKQFPLERQEVE